MTSHTSSHFESSPLTLGMAFHNLVHNLALPPEAPTAPPERRCGRFAALGGFRSALGGVEFR